MNKIRNYFEISNFKLIIILILFISCNSYKSTFIDEYDDVVLYKDKLDCKLFSYEQSYKHYNSKKCFNIKYKFNSDEFQKLKKLYKNVSELSYKGIKKNPINSVSEAYNDQKRNLINDEFFGLYNVSGTKFAPFFYFLRTENKVIFYNCNDKLLLFNELNNSNKITSDLKNKITEFINEKCSKKNGLKWYADARFY